MRFAAPEAVGRERDELRIAADGRRQRGRHQVERVIAADPGQVEHLGPPLAARRAAR